MEKIFSFISLLSAKLFLMQFVFLIPDRAGIALEHLTADFLLLCICYSCRVTTTRVDFFFPYFKPLFQLGTERIRSSSLFFLNCWMLLHVSRPQGNKRGRLLPKRKKKEEKTQRTTLSTNISLCFLPVFAFPTLALFVKQNLSSFL